MRVIVFTCLAMISLAVSDFVLADDHEQAEAPNASIDVPIPEELPEELKDEAFDEYVELVELRDAWRDMDHVALADIAEKLAAGERKLNRNHKVGCSKTILMRAARAAAVRGDKQELERIIALFKQPGQIREQGNKEGFLLEVTRLLQVAGATRAAPEPVEVNINDLSGNTLDTYHQLQDAIETASIAGDTGALEGIAAQLRQLADIWPDALRNALQESLDNARASAGQPSEGEEILNKLVGQSRRYKIWLFRNTNRFKARDLKYQMRGNNNASIGGQPWRTQTIGRGHTWVHFSPGYFFSAKAAYATAGSVFGPATFCPPGNYKIVKRSGQLRVESE